MTPSLEDLRSEVVAEFARFVSADPVRVGIALKRGVRLEGMEQWLLPIGELAEGYAANVSTWIGQGEDPTERARRCKLYFKKDSGAIFSDADRGPRI